MDQAEAPEEFSLQDPVIQVACIWLRNAVSRAFAENWLIEGPLPVMIYSVWTPSSGAVKIHRHHLEMLLAHMKMQDEA